MLKISFICDNIIHMKFKNQLKKTSYLLYVTAGVTTAATTKVATGTNSQLYVNGNDRLNASDLSNPYKTGTGKSNVVVHRHSIGTLSWRLIKEQQQKDHSQVFNILIVISNLILGILLAFNANKMKMTWSDDEKKSENSLMINTRMLSIYFLLLALFAMFGSVDWMHIPFTYILVAIIAPIPVYFSLTDCEDEDSKDNSDKFWVKTIFVVASSMMSLLTMYAAKGTKNTNLDLKAIQQQGSKVDYAAANLSKHEQSMLSNI